MCSGFSRAEINKETNKQTRLVSSLSLKNKPKLQISSFFFSFFWLFWVVPRNAQDLLLALCPGILPSTLGGLYVVLEIKPG